MLAFLLATLASSATVPLPGQAGALVAWEGLSNVEVTGSVLKKTSGSGDNVGPATNDDYDGGAISADSIRDVGGGMAFSVTSHNMRVNVGLTNATVHSNVRSHLTHAFILRGDGKLQVRDRGDISEHGTYWTGDYLEVRVTGAGVTYARNGSILLTGTDVVLPTRIEALFGRVGASLDNAVWTNEVYSPWLCPANSDKHCFGCSFCESCDSDSPDICLSSCGVVACTKSPSVAPPPDPAFIWIVAIFGALLVLLVVLCVVALQMKKRRQQAESNADEVVLTSLYTTDAVPLADPYAKPAPQEPAPPSYTELPPAYGTETQATVKTL